MMDPQLSCAVLNSCLDLTLCSHNLSSGIDWRTDVATRGSDHFPILVCQPKLLHSPQKRTTQLTNWKVYRHLNTKIINTIDCTLQNFVASIRTNMERSTRVISVQGCIGVDAEYESLRAIRRRAERKCYQSGQVEHYLKAQRTHALMRRQLKMLAKKRWRSNCDSLSPFTSIP